MTTSTLAGMAAGAARGVADGAITVPRLHFVRVPSDMVQGIYNGKMPARSLLVHPECWYDFKRVASQIVLSDLTRTAESSLARMKTAPGLVQAPGYSDHNFGGAFDLGIAESVKVGGYKGKRKDPMHFECLMTRAEAVKKSMLMAAGKA